MMPGTVKVALIAPVFPFRGGIAKHSTDLGITLSGMPGVQLSVFSFSRQYPALLFPGKSDREPDGSAASLPFEPVFCLDSINPLSWRRLVDAIVAADTDVVILPNWTFFLAPCLGYIAKACRKKGIPAIIVAHNVFDHEGNRVKTWLSQFQLRQARGFITHGRELEAALRAFAPMREIAVHPLPIDSCYPGAKGLLPAREGVELLFFGLVRHYKGLNIALHALAQSGRQDIFLTVVGEFWEGKDEALTLIEALGLSAQVELRDAYVSDADAAEYFHRCDAVLLPYRAMTGSGVVPVAYRYGKPVIASDLPGFREVVNEGETGWLAEAASVGALAALLRDKVSRHGLAAMAPAVCEKLEEFSWQSYGDRIMDLMKKVVGRQ